MSIENYFKKVSKEIYRAQLVISESRISEEKDVEILPRVTEPTEEEIVQGIRDELNASVVGEIEPMRHEYGSRPLNWKAIATDHLKYGN